MVIIIIYLILFLNKRPKKIAKEKELEACAEKNPYFPPQFSFTSLKESKIYSLYQGLKRWKESLKKLAPWSVIVIISAITKSR